MVGKFNSKNHMTHYKHVQVNEQSRRKNEIKLLVNPRAATLSNKRNHIVRLEIIPSDNTFVMFDNDKFRLPVCSVVVFLSAVHTQHSAISQHRRRTTERSCQRRRHRAVGGPCDV